MEPAQSHHDPGTSLEVLAAAIAASPHNLVSRRAREELRSRHIPECVSFARTVAGPGPVLDLGSGGGLPGLVIAITRPELEVHLLESTGKKAAFLREMVATLALDVPVHHGRAEDLAGGPLKGAFGIVTARAVAPVARLAVWAEPYLSPRGRLYAIKGERWADEVAHARDVLERLDLEVLSDPSLDPALGPVESDPLPPRVVMIARRC